MYDFTKPWLHSRVATYVFNPNSVEPYRPLKVQAGVIGSIHACTVAVTAHKTVNNGKAKLYKLNIGSQFGVLSNSWP